MVRIAAGMTTGTMAILAAQPTDVVKIRMQAGSISPTFYVQNFSTKVFYATFISSQFRFITFG